MLSPAQIDKVNSLDSSEIQWPTAKQVMLKRMGMSVFPKGVTVPDNNPGLIPIQTEIDTAKLATNILIANMPLATNPVTAALALAVIKSHLPYVVTALNRLGVPIPSIVNTSLDLL